MPTVLHRAHLSIPISFSGAVELPKAGIVGTSLMGVWSYLGYVIYDQGSQVYGGYTFSLKRSLK